MPSDVDIAWAAGVLDADGCVSMRPPSRSAFRHPYVVVDSTDAEILDALIQMFGGSLVRKKSRSVKHRQAWSWRLYGATKIIGFLVQVRPYMRCPSKVSRADLLITEYTVLTKRNGIYTPEQRAAKFDMEERFMAIGHGRGASVRALQGNDSAGEEAALIRR